MPNFLMLWSRYPERRQRDESPLLTQSGHWRRRAVAALALASGCQKRGSGIIGAFSFIVLVWPQRGETNAHYPFQQL